MLYIDNYLPSGIVNLGTLTTGETEVVSVIHSLDLVFQIITTGSPADTFRAEGSLDNTNWANLSATDSDTDITTAGSKFLYFDGILPPYIRMKKVTGTSPASIKLYVGRVG